MATAGVRRPSRKGCPNHAIEFKRGLAAAACDPATSVAKLALEQGVNTNLVFRWRREYRMGKFGTPDPAHRPAPSGANVGVAAAKPPEPAVRLLAVQVPVVEADAAAASAYIEVIFRSATVRIGGVPEMGLLRIVLDTLAGRS